ncbi:helix-turn-helix domain-containing protein [Lysinibacillus sphaericus]|uniref:Transcriptional regulator n=1 Tax=Lysinibacillus sphaericus OT4b.31 TaxID=1285586 RepID=R7ZCS4_LYSSH|nr:helix-turn-helix transcriptional regulator [Lysinibacillus sphaericus]EON71801.1 transcriptional regulator [Lysinibacillus sphaericus OT4b.31]
MTIGNRVKKVRTSMSLNQSDFASRLGVISATISRIEKGNRNITEQMLLSICREFNVNETWLRTGEGEMFIQPATFSFDEQIKKSNLSELEIAIMRGYMELDSDVRKAIVQKVESIIQQRSEIAATTEEAGIEAEIDEELDIFRQELRDGKKAQSLSASQKQDII